MKAYIAVFFISYFFALIGENFIKKTKNRIGICSLGLSLILLCIVAGVRDLSIGTDIYIYFYYIFNNLANKGMSLIYEFQNSNVEMGFVILVYLGSLFKNVNFAMFLIELCVGLPIYIYAYKQKDKHSISFIIAIFILTMYVRSFNLMRQSIAMSIIILATYYFDNKKYKMTFFLTVLAILMHTSAMISVLIYIFIEISKTKKDNKIILFITVYAGLIIFVIGFEPILSTFLPRYARYLGRDSEASLTVIRIVKKLFWIILAIVNLRFAKFADKDRHEKAFLSLNLFITELILSILSIKVSNAGRIGYYFLNLGYIVLCPNLQLVCKHKRFAKICLICILFTFWYNMTGVVNSGDQTYPYISNILTFLN